MRNVLRSPAGSARSSGVDRVPARHRPDHDRTAHRQPRRPQPRSRRRLCRGGRRRHRRLGQPFGTHAAGASGNLAGGASVERGPRGCGVESIEPRFSVVCPAAPEVVHRLLRQTLSSLEFPTKWTNNGGEVDPLSGLVIGNFGVSAALSLSDTVSIGFGLTAFAGVFTEGELQSGCDRSILGRRCPDRCRSDRRRAVESHRRLGVGRLLPERRRLHI